MKTLVAILMVAALLYWFPGQCGAQGVQPAPQQQALTPTPDAWVNTYGPPVTTRAVYGTPLYYRGQVQVQVRPTCQPQVQQGYIVRRGLFPCLFGPRWVARPAVRVVW